MTLQYITMNTYFNVVRFVEELQIDRTEIEPIDVAAEVLTNPDNAVQYLIRIMKKILTITIGIKGRDHLNAILEKLKKNL